MSNDKHLRELERKFEKLTTHLRRDWARTHPLTDKDKDVVRAAVRDQWHEEQKSKSAEKTESRQEKKKTQSKVKTGEKKKSQDKSNDHGFDQHH